MSNTAELAFLTLAREWLVEVQATPYEGVLERSSDLRALSCLWLAVEHGTTFTDAAHRQMEANRAAVAARRQPSWIDELPWELCMAAKRRGAPEGRTAVRQLTANLDHSRSSIRCWMMELGWVVVGWLNPVKACAKLLKNLADTLGEPLLAAGLAARFFDTPEAFFTFARTFQPPAPFEAQYGTRLKYAEENGLLALQASFWETEALCRREIARVSLG